MESLYVSSNRLIDEIQEHLFPRLESTELNRDQTNAAIIESEIEDKLRRIDNNCDQLEIMVNKEAVHLRPESKMRLNQLRYDSKHLLSALRNLHQRRIQREREEREREELLTKRFTTNSETNINIDYFVDENSRLKGFHSNVDELIASGTNILSNLKDQRGFLKSAQKRIIDIGNTLGLSNTVMRLIEKRSLTDKYILFGGMFVFILLMFLMWKYLT